MAILLVMARNDLDDASGWNRGDVVEVRSDDAPLGKMEQPGGAFHIVKVPGVKKDYDFLTEDEHEWQLCEDKLSQIEIDGFVESGIGRMNEDKFEMKTQTKQRKHKIDISVFDKQNPKIFSVNDLEIWQQQK